MAAALVLLAAAYIVGWPLVEHGWALRGAETEFDRLRAPVLAGLVRTRAMEAMVVAWFFTRPLMSLLGRTHLFTDHPILGVGRGLGAPGAAGGVASGEGAG